MISWRLSSISNPQTWQQQAISKHAADFGAGTCLPPSFLLRTSTCRSQAALENMFFELLRLCGAKLAGRFSRAGSMLSYNENAIRVERIQGEEQTVRRYCKYVSALVYRINHRLRELPFNICRFMRVTNQLTSSNSAILCKLKK
jgi:hypothetical protein